MYIYTDIHIYLHIYIDTYICILFSKTNQNAMKIIEGTHNISKQQPILNQVEGISANIIQKTIIPYLSKEKSNEFK